METISRRDFLKVAAVTPVLALPSPVFQTESKVYAPPAEQTWLNFESKVAPYRIQYPSEWNVCTLYPPLINFPGMNATDYFGGGIMPKTTVKLAITSETVDPSFTLDDYIKQIEKEHNRVGLEFSIAIYTNPSRVAGVDTFDFYQRFPYFGIERYYIPLVVGDRKWLFEGEIRDNGVYLKEDEWKNIRNTIAEMINSFTLV